MIMVRLFKVGLSAAKGYLLIPGNKFLRISVDVHIHTHVLPRKKRFSDMQATSDYALQSKTTEETPDVSPSP